MLSRRKAFRVCAQAAAALALGPLYPRRAEASILVNDIHSKLNATQVDRIVAIDSEAELKTALTQPQNTCWS
jgi:predicted esterase